MSPKHLLTLLLITPLFIQTSSYAFFNYTLCKKEPIEFSGEKKYPFNSLHELKSLDDLHKFGLSSPDKTDHEKGTQLIMLALSNDVANYPDWSLAHGLLGTTMLNASPIEKASYQSFFMSLNNFRNYKMNENQKIMFLFETDTNAITKTPSLIVKRELVITAISRSLHNRFTYNGTGDFKQIYTPEKNRHSHKQLKEMLKTGLSIYGEFEDREFDDQTLLSILGITYATLTFDNVDLSDLDLRYLDPKSIYKKTLKITLDSLEKRPKHGYKFLLLLNDKMDRKKLSTKDKMLFTKKNIIKEPLLKIIHNDLNTLLEKPSKKLKLKKRSNKRKPSITPPKKKTPKVQQSSQENTKLETNETTESTNKINQQETQNNKKSEPNERTESTNETDQQETQNSTKSEPNETTKSTNETDQQETQNNTESETNETTESTNETGQQETQNSTKSEPNETTESTNETDQQETQENAEPETNEIPL